MKVDRFRIAAALTLAVAHIASAPRGAAPTPPKGVVVRGAKLIDTQNGTTVANPVIVIEDDKIKAVGPNLTAPAGAQVIDLGRATELERATFVMGGLVAKGER